ncbi:MAG TPA: hypothetical protein VH678_09925 [Xanthobacteraceae bacterium]|jgi:hypothetical protein
MQKYFFDLVGQGRSQYDYRGRVLAAPEKAFHLAELIALDLDVRAEGEWSGWSINVRNAYGQQYFSVPVPSPG